MAAAGSWGAETGRMTSLLLVTAVTLGAIIGSFLNVCIHRLPRDLSVVRPRSACPACGAPIAWYDNIPVLSWVMLRARCRRCRAPIAARYPLVEAATAALFAALLFARGPGIEWLAGAVFGAALIALILIDAEHQILPDVITLPGIAFGLLVAPLRALRAPMPTMSPWRALWMSCFAAALGYALLWGLNAGYRGWQALRRVPVARREDGIGQGDFKLLAMIGAFLGAPLMLLTLFASAVVGVAWGLLLMATRGYGWKSRLPYGVFLGGAAILAMFFGDAIVGWYLERAGLLP
jgi:leader peptidase (prepilin peptidase)/N-methyltransferase